MVNSNSTESFPSGRGWRVRASWKLLEVESAAARAGTRLARSSTRMAKHCCRPRARVEEWEETNVDTTTHRLLVVLHHDPTRPSCHIKSSPHFASSTRRGFAFEFRFRAMSMSVIFPPTSSTFHTAPCHLAARRSPSHPTRAIMAAVAAPAPTQGISDSHFSDKASGSGSASSTRIWGS